MLKKFDKDITSQGMLLGFLSPLFFFPIVYLLFFLITLVFSLKPFVSLNSLVLLSIAPNFLWVRRSFNRKKMEHNGGGILMFTFVYIMLFFLARSYILGIHLPGLKF